jgi:hypothetical protein
MSESNECPRCGNRFEAARRGGVKIYCSRKCKQNASEARRAKAQADARRLVRLRENGPCAWCGGPCQPTTGGRKRQTCSQECRQRLRDARKTERYRSDPEYRQQVRERQTARYRRLGTKPMWPGGESICEWCDGSFASMGHGANRKRFCCALCRRRAEKERNRYFTAPWVWVRLPGSSPDGRHGEVDAKVSRQGGRVMAACPDCGGWMGGDSLWSRYCIKPDCGMTLTIDIEEAECVISKVVAPPSRP